MATPGGYHVHVAVVGLHWCNIKLPLTGRRIGPRISQLFATCSPSGLLSFQEAQSVALGHARRISLSPVGVHPSTLLKALNTHTLSRSPSFDEELGGFLKWQSGRKRRVPVSITHRQRLHTACKTLKEVQAGHSRCH